MTDNHQTSYNIKFNARLCFCFAMCYGYSRKPKSRTIINLNFNRHFSYVIILQLVQLAMERTNNKSIPEIYLFVNSTSGGGIGK